MNRKITATRMELLRVRKRLALAQRGHKLLKDKLEGLIKELTDRLGGYTSLRMRVDEAWPRIFQRFALADAAAAPTATENALLQARPKLDVAAHIVSVMGVRILEADAKVKSAGSAYSLLRTSPHLDEAVRELRDFLPDLVKLAAVEHTIRALCAEVQKTRRRANALEYVLIPDLAQARRTIQDRLEEIARSDVSRLMKVKQMLLEREEA